MKYPWYDEFLRIRNIPYTAKIVYAAACLQPANAAEIADILYMSRATADTMANRLVELGWVEKRRDGRRVLILPTAPFEVQVKYAKRLRADLEMAVHAGEARMKLLVEEIQVCRDFLDNVRPIFFRSPVSGFNLEVDRLARGQLFWDYRGAQHRGPTRKYPNQRKADITRMNDLLKQGMSVEQGVRLIVVYKKDLSIEGIQKLIPKDVKTWPLVEGPYLDTIRQICREYQAMDTGEDSLPGEERSDLEALAKLKSSNKLEVDWAHESPLR